MSSKLFDTAINAMIREGYLVDFEFMMIGIRFKAEASDSKDDILLLVSNSNIERYHLNTIPSSKEILQPGQYTYTKASTLFDPYYGQQRSQVIWKDEEGWIKTDEFEPKLQGINIVLHPVSLILQSKNVMSGFSPGSQIVSSRAYLSFREKAKKMFTYTLLDADDLVE
jgi:hypothetical protein